MVLLDSICSKGTIFINILQQNTLYILLLTFFSITLSDSIHACILSIMIYNLLNFIIGRPRYVDVL